MNLRIFIATTIIAHSILAQVINLDNSIILKHRGRNGGISAAADFVIIAQNIASIWEEVCIQSKFNKQKKELNKCQHLNDFKNLLNKDSSSYVIIKEEKFTTAHDGDTREATNNGIDEIVIDKNQWLKMQEANNSQNQLRMIKLVAHEYFTILGLDGSDYYKASNELVGSLIRKGYSPTVLSRFEGLPSLCSVNLFNADKDLTIENISSLETKNYLVNAKDEVSRYGLKIKKDCNPKLGKVLCSGYIELTDLLTGKVVVDAIFANSTKYKKIQQNKNYVLKRLLNKIPKCTASQ
ncbi:MAG: hypothetical protein N4A33_03560 [Bacteriovoracaceae bacterium]|jgi:hypothetical protein|nr:hypothetical protein [Bacteriovoracaceae bacterium]